MDYWIIADTHFCHKNIIKYCNRPFSNVDEMNEELIKRWNDKVKENDIVFHLGDFSKEESEEENTKILSKLKGNIFLILGNHDINIMSKDNLFVTNKAIIIDNFILTHEPLSKEEIPKGFINIHGHIHHRKSVGGINACVEMSDYYPINLNDIKEL